VDRYSRPRKRLLGRLAEAQNRFCTVLLSDPEAISIDGHALCDHFQGGQTSPINTKPACAVFVECFGAVEVEGAARTLVAVSCKVLAHTPKTFFLGGADMVIPPKKKRLWK
jgi:hypothetical protein